MANKVRIGLLGAGRIGKLHGMCRTQTSTQWLIRS